MKTFRDLTLNDTVWRVNIKYKSRDGMCVEAVENPIHGINNYSSNGKELKINNDGFVSVVNSNTSVHGLSYSNTNIDIVCIGIDKDSVIELATNMFNNLVDNKLADLRASLESINTEIQEFQTLPQKLNLNLKDK